MSEIEAAAVAVLREHAGGLTLGELKARLESRGTRSDPGVVESLLLLSGRVVERDGRWYRQEMSRAERIVDALEQYAENSGRRLFRADRALETLPMEFQPTPEELAEILPASGRFELLPNNMVRRRG